MRADLAHGGVRLFWNEPRLPAVGLWYDSDAARVMREHPLDERLDFLVH